MAAAIACALRAGKSECPLIAQNANAAGRRHRDHCCYGDRGRSPRSFFSCIQIDEPFRLAVIFASTIGLALVGATDDIRPLEAIPRLVLQTAAVAAVIATFPDEMRVVPMLPWWLDRAVVLVGGVWLVNIVNFMDGIDWMTVAEVVPVTAGLALFWLHRRASCRCRPRLPSLFAEQ